MVYESDFYTTRRPYTRPYVSSYTVTSPIQVLPLSSVIQLRSGPYYHHYMPYVAHKRLVTIVHSPVHNVYYSTSGPVPIRIHARVRPSVLMGELDRIRNLPRRSTESYTEKYLNSKDHIYFDDEAKEIRARVDSLLRRVHVFVPRATPSDFAEEIIPERMRSGDYVRRLLSGRNNTKKDLDSLSWYEIPERSDIGNLSCVKFIAGKPQSKRKPYFKVADLRPSDIRTDVNLLSFYSKNRQAAANALKPEKSSQVVIEDNPNKHEEEPGSRPQDAVAPDAPMTERELRKARALQTEWSDAIEKRERQVKEEQEPIDEPSPEPEYRKKEPEQLPEPCVIVEEPASISQVEVVEKSEPVSDKKKVKKEKKQKDKEKEENVKKFDPEIERKAAKALAKETIQTREEEDKKKAAEAERLRLEVEEQKAMEAWQLEQEQKSRADVIAEQERLEAERKAEEERIEAERIETERIAEEERRESEAVAAAIAAEEERIAIEKCLEEKSQQQEQEERLAAEASATVQDEPGEMQPTHDEPSHIDVTDRDREDVLDDIVTEYNTRVEEENAAPDVEIDNDIQASYILEPEGPESRLEEESPTTGGNGMEKAEDSGSPGGEEAHEEVFDNAIEDTPQVEEDFWGRTNQDESYSRKKQMETMDSTMTSNEEDPEMNVHTEMDNGGEAIDDDQPETTATTENNIYLDQEQFHEAEIQLITNEETGEEEEEEEEKEKEHFQFQSEDKIQLTEDNTNIDDVISAGDDVFEWGDGDA